MNKLINGILTLSCAGIVLCSCTGTETKPLVTAASSSRKVTLPEPFHFAKALEVKPGLTLDVFGWGRGTESGGAYLVLLSDSTHLKYRSVAGELDGKIVDAWNMDMDADGNPELFIQAKGNGEGSYLNLYVYEFNSAGEAQQIHFPELRPETKKTYRGMDSLYLKDGRLRREFPLFKEEDNTSHPTGGKKIVEYDLQNNSFTIKEIAADAAK